MKKFVLFFAMMACIGHATAQDVVYYGSYSRYMFLQRNPSWLDGYHRGSNSFSYGCENFLRRTNHTGGFYRPIFMYRYYTPDSLYIYGVAVALCDSVLSTDGHWPIQGRLGKRFNGHQGPVSIIDSTDRENGLRTWGRFNRSWFGEKDTCLVDDVYLSEMYFDTPRLVVDSFYIGLGNDEYVWADSAALSGTTPAVDTLRVKVSAELSNDQTLLYVSFDTAVSPYALHSGYYDVETSWLWYYFPIVAPPCFPMDAPSADSLSPGVFLLQWDSLPDSVQISIALDTVPPDQGRIMSFVDTNSVLLDLGTDIRYLARVRRRCPKAVGAWSHWSQPIVLYHHPAQPGDNPDPNEGITPADGARWTLSPNPATGHVHITSAETMQRVEIYDMQGRLAIDLPVGSTEADIDISALAAGQYTVLVRTAASSAAKALVVK